MKATYKQLGAIILAAILGLGLFVPAVAAPASFSDVSSNAWYAQDVADVQKYGIINGVGSNRFAPDGVLTFNQAVAMAARTYAYMHRESIPNDNGDHWAEATFNYAKKNGILYDDMVPANASMCTRLTMAELFYYVIDGMDNSVLNEIYEIPDYTPATSTAPVLFLYQYGVLTGSDKYGTFYPDRSITRAETAAILNRIVDMDKRKSFTLVPRESMTPNEAISLVVPVAIKEQELYGAVVMRDTGEVLDVSEDAYVIQIGVADFIDENGEWGGGGFWAVYWVSRHTGEVRFVTGLQDDYVSGMVDMKTGDYLGYPGQYGI